MTNNLEFQELLKKFQHIPYIRPSMLPRLELYMDQVTTFMEERLGSWRRSPEDKILTKTMINNYTKNRLLPPPVRKKYSPNHLLMLNYIYYLKNILSINDISTLMRPMTDRWWNSTSEPNMKSIYRELLSLEHQMYRDNLTDIQRKIDLAEHSFDDPALTEEDHRYLQKFVFIGMLAFDVSLKKRMMETLIDGMKDTHGETEKATKKTGGHS